MKNFTATSGAQQVSIDILGPISETMLLGFVKNIAFVESASTNPFHFHHYDMTSLMFVNRVQYPSEPLTMDCSSPYGVSRAYESLLQYWDILR